MLSLPLSWLPGTLLLRSDRMMMQLCAWLDTPSPSSRIPSIQAILVGEINLLTPHRYRLDDAERAIQTQLPESAKLDYTFSYLDDWFDALFEIDGKRIQVQHGQEELYEAVLARLHPSTIIGYRLARDLARNRLKVKDVIALSDATRAHFLRPPHPWQELAENHIHFSGSYGSAMTLMEHFSSQATPDDWYAYDPHNRLPHVPDIGVINSNQLSVGQLVDLAKAARRLLLCFELQLCAPPDLHKRTASILRAIRAGRRLHHQRQELPRFELFDHLPTEDAESPRALLSLARRLARQGNREAELLLHTVHLHWILLRQGAASTVGMLAKLQLHLINLLRSYMVMGSNLGLSHFARFYDSSLRDPGATGVSTELVQHDCACQSFDSGTTLLEGRITPKALEPSRLIPLIHALERRILYHQRQFRTSDTLSPPTDLLPLTRAWRHADAGELPEKRYKFVVHFLRSKDDRTRSKDNHAVASQTLQLPPRHARLRLRLHQEALSIEEFLLSAHWQNLSAWDLHLHGPGNKSRLLAHRAELQKQKIDLTSLVTGLDVAGVETSTPPEVYAPVINRLRTPAPWRHGTIPTAWPRDELTTHPRLHIMVHAGEDFPHIIQGMRRIDESVRYYQMGHGDRLGHALALGLNPAIWLERQGEVMMTAGEYLDNLVWIEHQIRKLALRAPRFAGYTNLQTAYIHELCTEIYGTNHSAETLFVAWERRDQCPFENNKTKNKKNKDDDPTRNAQWLLKTYHHDPSVRRNMNAPMVLSKPDRAGLGDCELWEAVQDMLMERYCDMGIGIETNPSSNVFIADLRHYGEHPIFRWHPPKARLLNPGKPFNRFGLRRSHLACTVNTDDPTIFPTTLHHELQLLKKAAMRHHDCSEIEAEAWVESLRKHGILTYKASEYRHFL